MKKTVLLSISLIPLMLIVLPFGYAGNPPPPLPPGEQYGNLVGPDIHGTITFVQISSCNDPSTPPGVSITFDGTCKDNTPVYNTFFFPVDFFSCVSPEWLLGTCGPDNPCGCNGLPQQLQLTIPIPDNCYPPNPKGKKTFNEYPVVTKVHNFYFDGSTVKTAEITAKWLTIVPAE